jgi:hypothetical protein
LRPPCLVHHHLVITSASFPSDLSSWNQDEHPYYLEVFGESEPVLDMTHAEVIPAGEPDTTTPNATPIYEYSWTIGRGGGKPEHRHLFGDRAKLDLWHRLEDVAARVYLYFPISGGWRVQELAASAKYLSPVQEQYPRCVKGFDWSVEKVTVPPAHSHGVMQGVGWAIPRQMFELLGGRLTGSLAVSFIPTRSKTADAWQPQPLPMLAHAAVFADGETGWVPAQNQSPGDGPACESPVAIAIASAAAHEDANGSSGASPRTARLQARLAARLHGNQSSLSPPGLPSGSATAPDKPRAAMRTSHTPPTGPIRASSCSPDVAPPTTVQ